MMKSAVALVLCTVSVALAQTPTAFIVGDSTASNSERLGWGTPFADYFDAAKVHVANRARAGRSSRTFQTEGLWDAVLRDIKPGDFVLIQFGHNDGSAPDKDRARGSLPGLGEESQEFTMPNGEKEVVRTFGWYMRKYITDTKAKGATPILLSLTVRNIWTDGKVERGSGNFSKWSSEIAQSQVVDFIDLTNIAADRFEQMGPEAMKELFPIDHTHTSQAGADLNAALVISGLKRLVNHPLLSDLSVKGRELAVYTPARGGARRPLILPEPADPQLPSLFLIGDSTVRNGWGDGAGGQWGWGDPIRFYFDRTKINVVNRAVGGLSSRTYLTGGQWEKTLALLKPGDVVIMQFGHNDDGPANDNSRARGSIKGTGEETQEIDNLLTKQHEIVHSYGWYLRKFIADTRAKRATPIVCSLIPRKIWKDGKIARNSETYGKWAAEVAQSEKAPFIDLNEMIARRYDEMGSEKVELLFADEHTHTSLLGAELNAATVVAGLKSLKDDPLAGYFRK